MYIVLIELQYPDLYNALLSSYIYCACIHCLAIPDFVFAPVVMEAQLSDAGTALRIYFDSATNTPGQSEYIYTNIPGSRNTFTYPILTLCVYARTRV